MVLGLIYKYGKTVLLPPQLPHPLLYLIGLEAKDPSFHASPPSSTTTSNPLLLTLLVLIMPLSCSHGHAVQLTLIARAKLYRSAAKSW